MHSYSVSYRKYSLSSFVSCHQWEWGVSLSQVEKRSQDDPMPSHTCFLGLTGSVTQCLVQVWKGQNGQKWSKRDNEELCLGKLKLTLLFMAEYFNGLCFPHTIYGLWGSAGGAKSCSQCPVGKVKAPPTVIVCVSSGSQWKQPNRGLSQEGNKHTVRDGISRVQIWNWNAMIMYEPQPVCNSRWNAWYL